MWNRHRFHANADDCRPIVFPPPGPWWCTGYGEGYSIVVAYLPVGIDVTSYWPEATQIDTEEKETIVYSSRFPKPDWFN